MVKRYNTAERGFTLIELLVVIMILTLVLGISIPAIYKGVSKTKLRAFTRTIASQFRYARSQAVSRKVKAIVTVDLGKNTVDTALIKIDERDRIQSPDALEKSVESPTQKQNQTGEDNFTEPLDEEAVERRIAKEGFAIVAFQRENDAPIIREGKVKIVFSPLGTSSGGELYVRGSRANYYYIVSIDRVSGRCSIFQTSTLPE